MAFIFPLLSRSTTIFISPVFSKILMRHLFDIYPIFIIHNSYLQILIPLPFNQSCQIPAKALDKWNLFMSQDTILVKYSFNSGLGSNQDLISFSTQLLHRFVYFIYCWLNWFLMLSQIILLQAMTTNIRLWGY